MFPSVSGSASSSATASTKTGDINPNVLSGTGNHGFSLNIGQPETISPVSFTVLNMTTILICGVFTVAGLFLILKHK